MSGLRFILLAFVAFFAASSPTLAGCRLGIHDCRVISDEMRSEAVQEIQDELTFSGMAPAQRTQYLVNRKYDRLGVRMSRYPQALRNEWARLNGCAYQASVAAMRGLAYVPSAKCRD